MLSWSQTELAERSSITRRTIALIEEGKSAQYQRTDDRLREVFEAAGVGFQNDGNGVIGVTLNLPDVNHI
jgi:transcriptional regulator with XRE-family HTH domain